jgi:hypothetical protein
VDLGWCFLLAYGFGGCSLLPAAPAYVGGARREMGPGAG